MTAELRACFDALGEGTWDAFERYVAAELGGSGVQQLRGFGEQELREAFAEFCAAEGVGGGALRKGRCVRELARWAAGDSSAAAADAPPPPAGAAAGAAAGLRRRDGAADSSAAPPRRQNAAGDAAQADGAEPAGPAEPTAAPQRRPGASQRQQKPTLDDLMSGMSFRGQVCFMIMKTILTLLVFTLLHHIVSEYVLKPVFHQQPQQPSVDEIVRRMQREGPRTFSSGGMHGAGGMPGGIPGMD